MRLGAPLMESPSSPGDWVEAVRREGHRAAYCPVTIEANAAEVLAYREAAEQADIVIAEVGAWSNPISANAAERRTAMERCQKSLELAERIGASCCVNIAGARGTRWDGPHEKNLTEETFDLIVASVREIIDAVKPKHAVYALETMPWIFPHNIDDYERLLRAIDRPGFGVHLDFVNLISSVDLYINHRGLIEQGIARLGRHVRSIHVKDILLQQNLTVHLDEVRPGLGGFDHRTLLRAVATLSPDMPVMLEHLATADEYRLAADHLRGIAASEGLKL